jgi:hypothetical protein
MPTPMVGLADFTAVSSLGEIDRAGRILLDCGGHLL